MLLKDIVQIQVHRHIAAGEDHIVLTDTLQVGIDTGQGVHTPLVFALPPLVGIAEGGQYPQTAVLPGEVPVLAGAHVVQQRLIIGVDDESHIGDAGIYHIGEHEIHDAVAPAIGDGAGVPVLGELPELRIGAVGKDDPVQLVGHFTAPPFTFRVIMALGGR